MSEHNTPPIPEPKAFPILGHLFEIDADQQTESMTRLARLHGPIFRLTLPGEDALIVSSVKLATELCDEARFEKEVHAPLREIRALAGDGLFTAYPHEPNWARAHRILLPAFGPNALRSYFDDMLDIADQLCLRWERFGPEHEHNVPDEMTRLTLDTIALSAFGYRFNSFYRTEEHPFVRAMVGSLIEAGLRTTRLPGQTWFMRGSQQQFNADIAYQHKICDELIAARRRAPVEREKRDLLDLLLHAKDPVTGERLDNLNIRYQLVTFLIAGHETTSGMLSFAIHLLLDHPAVLARAQALVDEVLGDATPRFEHLSRLGYLDQVLRETLRMYPTAPGFGVRAKQDTTIGSYPIKRGQVCFVNTPVLHRDPEVWSDPERFDPDRFAPEVREALPAKAWLPFGNGQRSCIGRAFAMQEAVLVLAMLLRRFELSRPGPYTMKIKESLTIKPAALFVRARKRAAVQRADSAGTTRAVPAEAPAAAGSPTPGKGAGGMPLLVLYGSNSGASEGLARRIASDGAARGFTPRVATLDDFGGQLPRDGATIIVTSSYNGQPPDNARAFFEWTAAIKPGSLVGVSYAVFGCGSRDWRATYQAVPMSIDQRLREAGARDVYARGEADAAGDFFGDFERWYGGLWPALAGALAVAVEGVEGAAGPLYTVEITAEPGGDLVRNNRLSPGTVLENRELVDMRQPGARSKCHIEIALPSGMSYEAGDYLAVLPENPPEFVERIARRMGLELDATLVLRSSRGEAAASLPLGRPISVAELFGRHVELSTPATRRDLSVLAQHNVCPPHRAHLEALARDADRHRSEILDRRVSVLDLLMMHTSTALPLPVLLELLPAMRVRQYSISSSPRQDPTRCSLTVAVVNAPALSGSGQYLGTCSTYLTRLQVGDTVAVAVRKPSGAFRPPLDNATPMIMACAGTGLAPFRGFLQERAARKAAGEATGPALLFFGCDHPDIDFLYRDELSAYQTDGVVEVYPAFFRQPKDGVEFVQHRIWKERNLVRERFEQGATVYVCGDGKRMAPAVEATFLKIYQEATGCSDLEAQRWAEEVDRQGRFYADVFS